MALWDSKILYVFLEVTSLRQARVWWEEILGLEVIENEFHPPHHRHGVIKYDAGETIVALNIANHDFDRAASEGILMVFSTAPMLEAKVYAELQIRGYPTPRQPGGIIVDRDNHQYALRQTASMSVWADDESPPSLQELHIGVTDMAESLLFYGETLGLVLLHQDKKSATFATGNIKLVLQDWQTLTGQPLNRPDGSLIVFNTERIQQTYEELSKNGLRFKSEVVYSDIGGSARFTDPTGHVFCLYERSEESLSWGSGWKVREIISRESSLSLGQVIIDT